MNVAIQGQGGSFHAMAAKQFFNDSVSIIPCRTFTEVAEVLVAGHADRAVMAVENSLFGSINDTYDLILEHNFSVIGEVYEHISFHLLAKQDIELESITEVYSQAPAIGECKHYLRNSLPWADIHEVNDTAAAAERVAQSSDPGVVAIASQRAGEIHNLISIDTGIEDHATNYTRFFIVSRQAEHVVGNDKTSLVFRTNHTPGALHTALGCFASRGLNLSKIESRPIVTNDWNYIFYIDITSGTDDDALTVALKELEASTEKLTVLGHYKKGSLPEVDVLTNM